MIRAATFLLTVITLMPPAPARADCIADAEALVPQAQAITNEVAKRIALQELRTAVEDGNEDGESFCIERLQAAEKVMLLQPFQWQPGQQIDHAEDTAPSSTATGPQSGSGT
jgi:hypothetical protein